MLSATCFVVALSTLTPNGGGKREVRRRKFTFSQKGVLDLIEGAM